MRMIFFIAWVLTASLWSVPAHSQEAPWGTAAAPVAGYAPQKVVYDVTVSTTEEFEAVLDRMSALNIEYGSDPYDAAIIAVLRGPEIRFFDVNAFDKHEELIRLVHSLTSSGVIEFRMCQHAARRLGLEPEDIHGFVEMVPMGDAEIIRLQLEEGYAYIK